MRVIVLVACAACGRVGFDSVTGLQPDPDGAIPDSADLLCITDQFDTMPPDLFQFGSGTVQVAGGALHINVNGTKDVDGGLTSNMSSFVGRTTMIHVVVPSAQTAMQTGFGWHQTTGSIHIAKEGGQLRMTFFDSATFDYLEYASIPFDPVAHAYWRLAADGDGVLGQFSSDGVTFHDLAHAPGFDVSAIRVDFGLGSYQMNIGPDTASFDDLERCEP